MRVLCVGLSTVDVQYLVDDLPKRNKKIKTDAPLVAMGGPATNAALLCSHLGDRVCLVTAFGRNGFCDSFDREMKQFGVRVHDWMFQKEFMPILASIFTYKDNGDRSIVSSLPSSSNKNFHHVSLGDAKWDAILVDGFYISHCVKLMRSSYSDNIPVVLDGGSWKEGMDQLLPYINIAICSEDFMPPDCFNIEDVRRYLFQFSNIQKVVVTRGDKPLIWYDGEEEGEMCIENVEVKDTLGAGDFFHGAFVFYITKYPFVEALQKAATVATSSCKYFGTRDWFKELSKN
ncbi:PfkB family carbohydrate kinase [Prolixibacteraceae bacterium]|nr:PfkB family carbohydrate kinase [Prolixibacteraceae bacterium]